MKLDSRILEGKKPLNCFDTEQAKQFSGEFPQPDCDKKWSVKSLKGII